MRENIIYSNSNMCHGSWPKVSRKNGKWKKIKKINFLKLSKNHRNQYLRPPLYVKLTQHFENQIEKNRENIFEGEKWEFRNRREQSYFSIFYNLQMKRMNTSQDTLGCHDGPHDSLRQNELSMEFRKLIFQCPGNWYLRRQLRAASEPST